MWQTASGGRTCSNRSEMSLGLFNIHAIGHQYSMYSTKRGVCAANIDPKRPTVEQKESKLLRQLVGNISEVKKYKSQKLPVDNILAEK